MPRSVLQYAISSVIALQRLSVCLHCVHYMSSKRVREYLRANVLGLIAIFIAVVSAGILATGFLFNAIL